MLRFTYTSGSSFTGDFALDDIRIGDCLTVGCVAQANSPCSIASGGCNQATGRCAVYADGTTCDDGNAQTADGICDSGLCRSCPVSTDDCVIAGTFDPLTQQCSAPTAKADGTTCDDNNAKTTNEICDSGTCQGCPVPTDDCGVGGTFNAATQQCSATTTKADGTACDAGGTVAHGSCDTGICEGIAVATSGFEKGMDGWTTGGTGEPFLHGAGLIQYHHYYYYYYNQASYYYGASTCNASETMPSAAAVGNGYVFAETLNNYNLNFDLEKTFPAGQELYGIAFQYHMYGAAMGSAVLESSADGTSWVSLWSKSGNLGESVASGYCVCRQRPDDAALHVHVRIKLHGRLRPRRHSGRGLLDGGVRRITQFAV